MPSVGGPNCDRWGLQGRGRTGELEVGNGNLKRNGNPDGTPPDAKALGNVSPKWNDNGKTSLNRRLAMLMMAILATLKATMLMPNEFPSPGRHRHGSEKAHEESMGKSTVTSAAVKKAKQTLGTNPPQIATIRSSGLFS